MILIAGIPSEEPVARVIESAENLGIAHVVFSQRDALHYELQVDFSGQQLRAELRLGGQRIDLMQLQGVYFRMMDSASLPENRAVAPFGLPAPKLQRLRFVNDLFAQLADVLPCRVLNRPHHMGSNFSKLYQLAFIREAGLEVPASLLTNEPEAVADFEDVHGPLIYKSISGVRSIVKPLTIDEKSRLHHLRSLPTQFQECLQGHNVRVHVVGDALFAARISSESVDYRYASHDGNRTTMQPVDLPQDVAEKCSRLARALRLPLCGIDLFETEGGDFFCFEANPCPGYSYFQNEAGLPISDAIVRYLEYGTAQAPNGANN
ncbi:ATP-grasp domain-containing protein [Hymenobacter jejuensis]|nr:hypothetical protein [Hymenobacter jejuensis]